MAVWNKFPPRLRKENKVQSDMSSANAIIGPCDRSFEAEFVSAN